MAKLGILMLAFICTACSARKDSDPLVGTYVGWMFINGRAVGNSPGMSQELTLESGGKYVLQIESTVMMLASIKAEGTYKRTGDEVRFTGQQTISSDDGYKKETHSGPHVMTLKVVDGMLTAMDGKGDPYFFRKEGTGPPPLPAQLQLQPSEPAAVALLAQIEKTYSSLKSLRVTGSVKSQGGGFVAEDAKFTVLFQSPSKLRFEASIFDGKTEIDRAEVTWDGGANCWWYSKEFGETRDRSLGNALGIVSVNFGPPADILPVLLVPDQIGFGSLSESYPEAMLLPDEKVGEKLCSVLQLKSEGADVTRLWVDKSNWMILKLHEELRDVTVTFDPHPNATIDTKEFMLGKRSR